MFEIKTDEYDEKYVEITTTVSVKLYLDEDNSTTATHLNKVQAGELLDNMDLVELGETMLNSLSSVLD